MRRSDAGDLLAESGLECPLVQAGMAGRRSVLAAGGVADAGDVHRVLDEGPVAAVAGTRAVELLANG